MNTVLSCAEQPRDAANRGQRAERDDEGRQPQRAISTPLTRPKTRPDSEAGRDAEHAPARDACDTISADHGGRGEDRADRQVDAAGQDDEGHAGGEHDVDRRLLRDDREVLPG